MSFKLILQTSLFQKVIVSEHKESEVHEVSLT